MNKNVDPSIKREKVVDDGGDPKDKLVVLVDARPRVLPIRPIQEEKRGFARFK